MLKKIISLTISLIIITTGLILTDTSLPFLSNYLGYDLHGNGLMGITFASMILVLPGLFIFSWLALVLSPFITNALFNYAERCVLASAAHRTVYPHCAEPDFVRCRREAGSAQA